MLRFLKYGTPEFEADFAALSSRQRDTDPDVRRTVEEIITEVKESGDLALLDFSRRFDRRDISSASQLEISRERMAAAVDNIDPLVRDALSTSIDRVRQYHEKQLAIMGDETDWRYEDVDGNSLGQRIKPMQRVGIYVPGGKATYPSSVIMTAIPAQVAGVEEIILVSPAPADEVSEVLLAAASLAGVDRFFTVGGAQAIAALAYGTQLIPRVDKIVGPGNIYVATAKKMVFGDVGIDMVAGPSEVVVIADHSAIINWLVMDLFAQAEHDEKAQSILIATDQAVLDEVSSAAEKQLVSMSRKEIIETALRDNGALIWVPDLAVAAELANRLAPEHLELAVEAPDELLPLIQHAGAVFLGNHSAEVVGDYSAGPSHVLPTAGSARFTSPLGVYDFVVRTSVIHCSARGAVNLSRSAAIIAREEGLEAHALAAEHRLQG